MFIAEGVSLQVLMRSGSRAEVKRQRRPDTRSRRIAMSSNVYFLAVEHAKHRNPWQPNVAANTMTDRTRLISWDSCAELRLAETPWPNSARISG